MRILSKLSSIQTYKIWIKIIIVNPTIQPILVFIWTGCHYYYFILGRKIFNPNFLGWVIIISNPAQPNPCTPLSLTLIQAFKQNLCPNWNFMVNFFSVLDKVSSVELVEFMWIPRDFNVEAHNLSIRARQLKLMDCMLIWECNSYVVAFCLPNIYLDYNLNIKVWLFLT